MPTVLVLLSVKSKWKGVVFDSGVGLTVTPLAALR